MAAGRSHLVGLISAIAAQGMNRSLPVGFADLNRFHLLWLWFVVFFYVNDLIGPTLKIFNHNFGSLDWIVGIALGIPLGAIGILFWLISGYFGLALLSAHRGRNRRPAVRNFLGVVVLLLPVMGFILMNLLALLPDD